MKPAFYLLIFSLSKSLFASEIRMDTLRTDQISGQSDGIRISSFIYVTTGSSFTLTGPSGYITGFSSITASSFFGDGSHLSGLDATTAADLIFSGANTFLSSFTIRTSGHEISLSSGPTRKNLLIDSSGNLSFEPTLHNSSRTIVENTTTSLTSCGSCVPSSTVTINTSGGRVEATFTGMGSRNLGASYTMVGLLQDGQYVTDTSSKSSVSKIQSGLGRGELSFNYILDAPPPGSHSYCITLCGMDNPSVTLYNDTASAALFYVKEIK
jgi:hypothetical protein